MTRLAILFVALMPVTAQANTGTYAQESDTEIEETADGQADPQSGDDVDNTEYYVVDDSDDTWPEESITEEQYALDDTASFPSEDSADIGLRPSPGLPLVAAQPATGQMVRRSLGGVRVADAAAPWQAQIYYPKVADAWKAQLAAGEEPWVLQHYCGGALVAPNWVLTAAHCIDDRMMRAGYRVRLGQERIDLPGGWTYKIDKVIRNPEYKALKSGDIALIHIVKDQQQADPPASQVRPIPLFRGTDANPSELVTAYGWGRISNTGNRSNAIMLKVRLNIVDRPTCARARVAVIDARVVCAAAPGRKTCRNDSGGPLVNATNQLVGLVSTGGKSCADDGVPGVYTRVGAYLPWITQETGGAVR